MLLIRVALGPVNSLDVLPKRTRVRIALRTFRDFTDIRFLGNRKVESRYIFFNYSENHYTVLLEV